MTIAIITVALADAGTVPHPEDADVPGAYAVALGDGPGQHPDTPRRLSPGDDPIVEAALDAFHDRIGISVLDDYDIGVTVLTGDAQGPVDAHWL